MATLFGVAMFSPAAGAAARLAHRLAARAPARHHRPAGARERRAQARPYRGHRRRADDRPRGGGLRHRVRGRSERLGEQRDRPQLPGRPRPAEHRRLLPVQPRRGPDRRTGGGRGDGVLAQLRRRRARRQGRAPVRRRPGPGGRRSLARLGGGLARNDPELSSSGAVVDDAWAYCNDLSVGRRDQAPHSAGARRPPTRSRAPSRTTPTCSATWWSPSSSWPSAVRRPRAELHVPQARPGRRCRRGAGACRRGGGPALPHGRHAQPAGAQGQPAGTDQPGRELHLRAAGAGDRDLAARHRDDAGALHPRAHARARDAARGGHVARARCDAWCATRR